MADVIERSTLGFNSKNEFETMKVLIVEPAETSPGEFVNVLPVRTLLRRRDFTPGELQRLDDFVARLIQPALNRLRQEGRMS